MQPQVTVVMKCHALSTRKGLVSEEVRSETECPESGSRGETRSFLPGAAVTTSHAYSNLLFSYRACVDLPLGTLHL